MKLSPIRLTNVGHVPRLRDMTKTMTHKPITGRTRSGARCITRRPLTAREHYDAAVWLEDSPERIDFWRNEAIREQENHGVSA